MPLRGFTYDTVTSVCTCAIENGYAFGGTVCTGQIRGTNLDTNIGTGEITNYTNKQCWKVSDPEDPSTNGDYYPNWSGGVTCVNDGKCPEYMLYDQSWYLSPTLQDCCQRFYHWKLVIVSQPARLLPISQVLCHLFLTNPVVSPRRVLR